MKAWRSVWGPTRFMIPARRATRRTIRPAPCPAALLEVAAEALDVGPPRCEDVEPVVLTELGELSQVESVGLTGETAVVGEEARQPESFGFGEGLVDDDDG
jgi:hypothetical protein